MRVDEDGALEKSTYITNILVDEFNIYMENTGWYASWLNGKHKIHTRSIHSMVREYLLDSNQYENKWWYAVETSEEVYTCKLHSASEMTSPHLEWYVQIPRIHELRNFECDIYPIT